MNFLFSLNLGIDIPGKGVLLEQLTWQGDLAWWVVGLDSLCLHIKTLIKCFIGHIV